MAAKASAWRGFRSYLTGPDAWKNLVFYSEGPEYWLHYRPLVTELASRPGVQLSYVSSSPDDPGLHLGLGAVRPFYIGPGFLRTLWFMFLKARVLVTTMPDLETFHIKRSRLHPVRYVYVFHAPVSTHMMYREAAFDHYDEVFCVGPHHEREIRARENQAGLPEKTLFRHGYGRLDDLLAQTAAAPAPANDPLWALVAPSWTDNGIMATVAAELVRVLLAAGFRVTVRAHPRTRLVHPERLEALRREFGEAERFTLEDGSRESAALDKADIMVSDWSGVALEYAFVRGRPVLFVDTPRKVVNPRYESLGIEPMEAAVRSEVGEVIALDRLRDAPEALRRLCADPETGRERRLALRDKWIFNVGASGRAGAERLIELAGAGAP